MPEIVEVDFMHGDTPDRHVLTAERAWVRVFPDGRGRVKLQNGSDNDGPVSYALYREAIRIVRRPADG